MTSTDKNKMKPNKDPEHVAAGKKLAEHNRRVREEKEKKGGSKDPSPKGGPWSGKITTTTRTIIIFLTHSNSFSSKCHSFTGWTVI